MKNIVPTIIYPNPTSSVINITIGDKKLLKTEATLLDVNGRIIKQIIIRAETQSLDMSPYMNGGYFIRLANKEILRTVKQ